MPIDRIFMFNEKVIQISDKRVLTNKGRLFEHLIDGMGKTIWIEIQLPDFKKEFSTDIPKGKTKFIENETHTEKWAKIQLKDLK